MKKMICLMIVVCLTSSVWAATWDGGGAGDQWNTPENWAGDGVPGTSSTVDLAGGTFTVKLNSAQTIKGLEMQDAIATAADNVALDIGTGGALTVGAVAQAWGNGNGSSTINMTGNGSFTMGHAVQMAKHGGDFYLNMSDNAVFNMTNAAEKVRVGTGLYTTAADFALYGSAYARLYLDDNASMTVGKLLIGNDNAYGDGKVTVAGNSTLQITGTPVWSLYVGGAGGTGQLDITGDGSLIMKGLITDVTSFGNVTANGGIDTFAYSYDDVTELTTITAIPEPITIALLGFGGLFLRRRK